MDERLKAGAEPLKHEAPADLELPTDGAEEINRQAAEGQRELQRIADEADKALRGAL